MSEKKQWDKLRHAFEYRVNRDILVYISLENDPNTIVETSKVLATGTEFVEENLLNSLCIQNAIGQHGWVSSKRIVSLNSRPDGNFDLVLKPLQNN